MLNLVHQDDLDQGLSQNVLVITTVQLEAETSVQNQHQHIDQF